MPKVYGLFVPEGTKGPDGTPLLSVPLSDFKSDDVKENSEVAVEISSEQAAEANVKTERCAGNCFSRFFGKCCKVTNEVVWLGIGLGATAIGVMNAGGIGTERNLSVGGPATAGGAVLTYVAAHRLWKMATRGVDAEN